jgi:hypothetical protein
MGLWVIGGSSGRLGSEEDIRTYPEGIKGLSQGFNPWTSIKNGPPCRGSRVILGASNKSRKRFVRTSRRKF